MDEIGFNKIILPRYVYTGIGAIKELPNVLHHLNLAKGKMLIISGSTKTKDISFDLIKPIIEKEGLEVENVEINNIKSFVEDLPLFLHRVKESDAKILAGIGGGKVIDATKVLASLSNKRYLSIPTNTSHDGLSSPVISFVMSKYIERKHSIKFEMKAPVGIIADIKIAMTSSKKSIIAGIGDIIAKKTAVKDWRLANMLKGEEYSEYAASLALMSEKIIEENIDEISRFDEKALSIVFKALIGCGIAISVAGSSRPASGSEHLFSHALDLLSIEEGFQNELHGIQCGLGTIIMSQLHGLNYKKIKALLKKVGGPTNSEEINIDKKYLIKALMISNKIRKDRYTILGDSEITYEIAERLLKKVEII